jgi:hypothetical protein
LHEEDAERCWVEEWVVKHQSRKETELKENVLI